MRRLKKDNLHFETKLKINENLRRFGEENTAAAP